MFHVEHILKDVSILIIVNPHAHKGEGVAIGNYIREYLDERKIEYNFHISTSREDLISYISSYAHEYEKMFVVGGDGTFRDAIDASQRVNPDISIGLIPAGSGNDLVRTLNISGSVESLLEKYLLAKCRPIYCAYYGSACFVNVLGVGIDTFVLNLRLKLLKYLGGTLSYLISTIISMFMYRPRKYKLKLDEFSFEGECYIISVCNAKYFGAGMKIAPSADPETDEFDVILLKKVGIFKVIKAFKQIYTGNHVNLDYVDCYKSKKVNIQFQNMDELVNVDGDLFRADELIIEKSKEKTVKILDPML